MGAGCHTELGLAGGRGAGDLPMRPALSGELQSFPERLLLRKCSPVCVCGACGCCERGSEKSNWGENANLIISRLPSLSHFSLRMRNERFKIYKAFQSSKMISSSD